MSTVQKSLRIPSETAKAIEDLAAWLGRDFSTMAKELLTEAVKMRRFPGIFFADGPTGRRARLAGTGLDLWEVVATYCSLDRDFERLRQVYHWLSEAQLRTALSYSAAYPDEIEQRIARSARWTKERLAQHYPSLARDQA